MKEVKSCIAPDTLKQQLEAGSDILIIDVRSKSEFEENHIPCSLHIPLENLESEVKRLHEHYMLVTVCGKGGGRSAEAAEKLLQLNREVKWLCGGVSGFLEGAVI